jgi:hypothetical protein
MATAFSLPKSRGGSKLSPDKVREIAARLRAGQPVRDLARTFNVSASLISLIRSGERWSSVSGFPARVRPPNSRHAVTLLRSIGEHPAAAPVLRSAFDSKFGPGSAVRAVATFMHVGATQ